MGEASVMEPISMTEAFPFLKEKQHVISLVGAGGKTSLMYGMAEGFCKRGHRVLVTTSTHIARPDESVMAHTIEEAEALWRKGSYAVIGRAVSEEKLAMPDEGLLAEAMARADSVLIEADGARRLPCKAPGRCEPVILPQCDIVVGVLGLDALGRAIEDVCFRPEQVAQVCGKMGQGRLRDVLTESDMACLLASEDGLRKSVENRLYYAVLNKCDDVKRMKQASAIAQELAQKGSFHIVASSFRR